MMRIALMTVVLTALLLPAAAARACPMCKDTISETATAQPQDRTAGPQSSLPGGFNFSIYYMLGGLFCTIGLVAGVITKGIRDSNAAHCRRGFPPHR
jgi:hypothetical protein